MAPDYLFKPEDKREAGIPCRHDCFGIGHQGQVFQVFALVVDHVEQSEIEAQLGSELEEGQVEVASHTHVDAEVETLEDDGRLLLFSDVKIEMSACHHVGTVVVDASCADFECCWDFDIRGFELLVGLFSTLQGFSFEPHRPLLKIEEGRDAEVQMLGDGKVSHQSNLKRRIDLGACGPPALCSFIARVVDGDSRHAEPETEPPVKQSLVVIGQVLDFLLLCHNRHGGQSNESQQADDTYMSKNLIHLGWVLAIVGEHNNNVQDVSLLCKGFNYYLKR